MWGGMIYHAMGTCFVMILAKKTAIRLSLRNQTPENMSTLGLQYLSRLVAVVPHEKNSIRTATAQASVVEPRRLPVPDVGAQSVPPSRP